MPSIEENLQTWDSYNWPTGGDEWSRAWGGSPYLWYREIYPRIMSFLPCGTILEIAPGFGRWTKYLAKLAKQVWAIDLAPTCVQGLTERFRDAPHVVCEQNDGQSLPMIPDQSVDFAFSFDSLVHADGDAITGYLKEFVRVLRPGAFCFLHHSNMAEFAHNSGSRLSIANPHGRSSVVSAALVREWCQDHGLAVVCQEKINWGHQALTDVFSLIQNDSSQSAVETRVIENPEFMRQASDSARIAAEYRPRIHGSAVSELSSGTSTIISPPSPLPTA